MRYDRRLVLDYHSVDQTAFVVTPKRYNGVLATVFRDWSAILVPWSTYPKQIAELPHVRCNNVFMVIADDYPTMCQNVFITAEWRQVKDFATERLESRPQDERSDRPPGAGAS